VRGRQRFHCMQCHRTFVWRARHNSIARRQHWFRLWVTESYPVRLLCSLSRYSASKIKRIIRYWLGKVPNDGIDYSKTKYAIYDATYFHKDGCLLNLMDAINHKIIAHIYVQKENYKDAYHWFNELRHEGLDPMFVTTDGERSIMRAMRLVWPEARLQRCLYHLQHEGMRWLRTYPKTEAGKELRGILSTLAGIKTMQQRNTFVQRYSNWINRYRELVQLLPSTTVAYKDLRRTMALINNALPDMFHYLTDSNVPSTTNSLESFHSRLKSDYHRHRGLSKKHRIGYIAWYCHYKNGGN
jgi:transposase-like protein